MPPPPTHTQTLYFQHTCHRCSFVPLRTNTPAQVPLQATTRCCCCCPLLLLTPPVLLLLLLPLLLPATAASC
jgi:hypothetical protein